MIERGEELSLLSLSLSLSLSCFLRVVVIGWNRGTEVVEIFEDLVPLFCPAECDSLILAPLSNFFPLSLVCEGFVW